MMMRMRVPWFDVFALAVLGLLLLATAPRSAEADDKALGAESKVWLAAAAPQEGAVEPGKTDAPRTKMSAKRDPWPNQDGFIAPTLDGPWRFTAAMYGWLPEIPLELNLGRVHATGLIDLGTILDDLQFTAMLDFEVRKGPFGAYFAPIVIFLEDTETVPGALRSHKVTIDDFAFLADFGLSYEVGRWHLGKKPDSPAVAVEPFVGARWLIDDVKIKIKPGGPLRPGGDTLSPEIAFIAPVIGLRTFWDLTERWNVRIEGDYGGFDVDHLEKTWNALGIVGYRFRPTKSLAINVFAGYRYLYVQYKKIAKLKVSIRGPLIGVALEF